LRWQVLDTQGDKVDELDSRLSTDLASLLAQFEAKVANCEDDEL